MPCCAQVKHSHLTDVDTTDMSAAWAQSSKIVQRHQSECEKPETMAYACILPGRYQEKMAAAKGVANFERPSLKK